MAGKTPWITEGDLRVRYWDQPTGSKHTTQLVKHTNQPTRDLVMADTAFERKEAELGNKPRDLSFGRLVGRIPIIDALRLQKENPDLFSPDMQIAKQATVDWVNSTEGKPFRIQRA